MCKASLLGQLDMLAWHLRLRDGASAAMPRSLKRQLLKSEKSAKASHGNKLPSRSTPLSAVSAAAPERTDSQASTDSEDRELPGTAPYPISAVGCGRSKGLQTDGLASLEASMCILAVLQACSVQAKGCHQALAAEAQCYRLLQMCSWKMSLRLA